MNKPKISVIVPVYNVEKYLSRCINSILDQTFSDFELLLIDDGSKDKSGEICDEYAERDNRIKVFHKENGGVSSARNVGLDNAKGEWICFCDSDDWVENQFLYEFKNMMHKGDLLSQGFHSLKWKNGGDKNIFEVSGIYDSTSYFPFLLHLYKTGQLGYIWCKAFKREIIDEHNIRFDTKVYLREDLLFVLEYCIYAHSVNNSEACFYQYKYTTQGKYFHSQNEFDVCKKIYLFIRQIDKSDSCINEIKPLFIEQILYHLLKPSIGDKNTKNNVKFFFNEFGEYMHLCKGKGKRVKLFKMLHICKNERYEYFLVRLFHSL